MVGQAEGLPQITVLAVAVEHRPQARQEQARQAETVVPAQPQQLVVAASPTLAVVAAEHTTAAQPEVAARVAAARVELTHLPAQVRREPLIPAAVAAVAAHHPTLVQLLARAALESLF